MVWEIKVLFMICRSYLFYCDDDRLSARKGWALGLLVEFRKWRVLIGKWILPQHLTLNHPYTLRRRTNISFNLVSLYLFVKNVVTSPWDKQICNKIVLCVAAHSNIGSAAAPLLGLWLRIPPEAWMSVSFECCQAEVSSMSWSLVQKSPTYSGASLCVFQKHLKWGGHDPPCAEGNTCIWTINIWVCVCVCAGLKESLFCLLLWSLWCAAVCSAVAMVARKKVRFVWACL